MTDFVKKKKCFNYYCHKCEWEVGERCPDQCPVCGSNNKNSDNQWWRLKYQYKYE